MSGRKKRRAEPGRSAGKRRDHSAHWEEDYRSEDTSACLYAGRFCRVLRESVLRKKDQVRAPDLNPVTAVANNAPARDFLSVYQDRSVFHGVENKLG